MLFLFYVNLYGMRPQSPLYFQPLMIPGSLLYRVVYRPSVYNLVYASSFLAGDREAEVKLTAFTFQCFSVFSSSPNPLAI